MDNKRGMATILKTRNVEREIRENTGRMPKDKRGNKWQHEDQWVWRLDRMASLNTKGNTMTGERVSARLKAIQGGETTRCGRMETYVDRVGCRDATGRRRRLRLGRIQFLTRAGRTAEQRQSHIGAGWNNTTSQVNDLLSPVLASHRYSQHFVIDVSNYWSWILYGSTENTIHIKYLVS